jgi:hypothetical protein
MVTIAIYRPYMANECKKSVFMNSADDSLTYPYKLERKWVVTFKLSWFRDQFHFEPDSVPVTIFWSGYCCLKVVSEIIERNTRPRKYTRTSAKLTISNYQLKPQEKHQINFKFPHKNKKLLCTLVMHLLCI